MQFCCPRNGNIPMTRGNKTAYSPKMDQSIHKLIFVSVNPVTKNSMVFNYLAPEGVARYCFHPVCLSVCVCPANILVFYFSAIRRDFIGQMSR